MGLRCQGRGHESHLLQKSSLWLQNTLDDTVEQINFLISSHTKQSNKDYKKTGIVNWFSVDITAMVHGNKCIQARWELMP